MNLQEIVLAAQSCVLGSLNKRLTITFENGDEIVVTGRETVKRVYEAINGK